MYNSLSGGLKKALLEDELKEAGKLQNQIEIQYIYSNINSIHRKIKQRAAVKGTELTVALLCVQIWFICLDFDR